MLGKLWLRLLCWWYDLCPEHGILKGYNCDGSRYCVPCTWDEKKRQEAKLLRMWKALQ